MRGITCLSRHAAIVRLADKGGSNRIEMKGKGEEGKYKVFYQDKQADLKNEQ